MRFIDLMFDQMLRLGCLVERSPKSAADGGRFEGVGPYGLQVRGKYLVRDGGCSIEMTIDGEVFRDVSVRRSRGWEIDFSNPSSRMKFMDLLSAKFQQHIEERNRSVRAQTGFNALRTALDNLEQQIEGGADPSVFDEFEQVLADMRTAYESNFLVRKM